MAKPKNSEPGVTRARVLFDSVLGKADTVVELSADDLRMATNLGMVDATPEAVAYADSLVAGA